MKTTLLVLTAFITFMFLRSTEATLADMIYGWKKMTKYRKQVVSTVLVLDVISLLLLVMAFRRLL